MIIAINGGDKEKCDDDNRSDDTKVV